MENIKITLQLCCLIFKCHETYFGPSVNFLVFLEGVEVPLSRSHACWASLQ